MPTNAKTKERKKTERQSRGEQPKREERSESKSMNALELLERDHREVEELFDQYSELGDSKKADNKKKEQIVQKLCMMLNIHAQIEEEIFYPEVRRATKDDNLIDESLVEHASAKHLIDEIEEMQVGDDMFDAKVTVLEEQMKHHIQEEEEELFPEADSAKMDLEKVGERLAARKAELMEEFEEA